MIKEEELKKIAEKEEKEIIDVHIHHDIKKSIYTIRIPVVFARAVNLKENDKFRFILTNKYLERENKLDTNLKGEVIRG